MRAPAITRPRNVGELRDLAGGHRSSTIIVGMVIVTILMYFLPRFPPLSLLQSSGPWYDAFANAGVFVLLAMGLNVVVGLAGLLALGYGEIVPIVFLNLEKYTQGTNGIGGVFRPEPLPLLGSFGAITPFNYFILMAVIVTIAMILLYRLQDSRMGRAWMAIREDELAAVSSGINTITTKLLAFAMGATTAGL